MGFLRQTVSDLPGRKGREKGIQGTTASSLNPKACEIAKSPLLLACLKRIKRETSGFFDRFLLNPLLIKIEKGNIGIQEITARPFKTQTVKRLNSRSFVRSQILQAQKTKFFDGFLVSTPSSERG